MSIADVQVKEVTPLEIPSQYIAQQPIDRHLVEITDQHKSVFINAGIDSTCGRKRASIIHKFINGTIFPLTSDSSISIPVNNLLDSLTLNHSAELEGGEESSTSMCQSDVCIPECCTYCGK